MAPSARPPLAAQPKMVFRRPIPDKLLGLPGVRGKLVGPAHAVGSAIWPLILGSSISSLPLPLSAQGGGRRAAFEVRVWQRLACCHPPRGINAIAPIHLPAARNATQCSIHRTILQSTHAPEPTSLVCSVEIVFQLFPHFPCLAFQASPNAGCAFGREGNAAAHPGH